MADFIKQLSDTFSFFSKKKAGSVVGIDIGSAFIKVVQVQKKGGKAVLETYGELALGPYAGVAVGQATQLPPEKIAEALIDVMREANVTTKDAGLSLPLQSSLLSLMKMPTLDDKKLAELVPIEARKYIPVPISEVSVDWWILPQKEPKEEIDTPIQNISKKESTGMIDVMVVAILNEIVNNMRNVIGKAALEQSFL